jgi:preprotein translocase subunit SecE
MLVPKQRTSVLGEKKMSTANNNNTNGVVAWLKNSAAGRFVRETQSELRKVTWPTREEVIRLTVVVMVLSAVASVLLFAADALFAWGLLELQTLFTPQ